MKIGELTVDGYRIEALGAATWDAFADLAERHNGVWGGCWCLWFHLRPDPPERKVLGNREFKRHLVEEAASDRAGTDVVVEAQTDATLVVLSGEPIDEPIVGYGPFVMNTRAEIRQAVDDFNSGKFGRMAA